MAAAISSSANVLLANATRFAGPALLARLLRHQGAGNNNNKVVASDAAFADEAVKSEFAKRFPTAILESSASPARISQLVQNTFPNGHVHAVICNDYFPAIRAPIEEAMLEDLRDGFEALVVAPFGLLKALIPSMKAQKGGGRIVIISSASPLRGLSNYSMYCVGFCFLLFVI